MRPSYLKTDLKRCFISWKAVVAVAGVCAVHFLVPEQLKPTELSVFWRFNNARGSNSLVLAYLFTTYAYGQCFAEDMEQGYIKYALIRGNVPGYVLSKCFCIALSAELAMVCGRMLFVFLLRSQYPWILGGNEISALKTFDSFTELLDGGHYIAYLLLHGAVQGIWASVLALFSAWLSVHMQNRLLVLAFPIMTHHLLRRAGDIFMLQRRILDPDRVFLINYNVFRNERISLGAAVAAGIIFFIMFSFAIEKSVERRIANGRI